MAIDDRCKLFVAGLPDSISEAVLRELFEATGGTIVDVSVPRDRATGRPRGFGFVTLSSEQEATAARESLDGSVQSGRSISVRAFQAGPPKRAEGGGRGDGPPERGGGGGGGGGAAEDRTLYLGNLPYDATSTDVEQMLERAGVSAVVRVNLPLDPQGRPRGFGFVTLASADDAQLAVDSLRDAEMKGRRVSASIAHARGERPRTGPGPGPGPGPGMGVGGGGGGFSPRPPPRDAPSWGPDDRAADPSMPPPPDEGGEDRSGKKTKDKKKRGTRGPERGRTRRDGEGLRSPRARGFYDKDDE